MCERQVAFGTGVLNRSGLTAFRRANKVPTREALCYFTSLFKVHPSKFEAQYANPATRLAAEAEPWLGLRSARM